MTDIIKDVENAIIDSVKNLFPLHVDTIRPKLKVWMDHERGVIVSNIGMILGKEAKCKADVAAVMLAVKLRENPIFKEVYVS
jgi:arginyl-tRNA synthetase